MAHNFTQPEEIELVLKEMAKIKRNPGAEPVNMRQCENDFLTDGIDPETAIEKGMAFQKKSVYLSS